MIKFIGQMAMWASNCLFDALFFIEGWVVYEPRAQAWSFELVV
jgi:hypothetical protein